MSAVIANTVNKNFLEMHLARLRRIHFANPNVCDCGIHIEQLGKRACGFFTAAFSEHFYPELARRG